MAVREEEWKKNKEMKKKKKKKKTKKIKNKTKKGKCKATESEHNLEGSKETGKEGMGTIGVLLG